MRNFFFLIMSINLVKICDVFASMIHPRISVVWVEGQLMYCLAVTVDNLDPPGLALVYSCLLEMILILDRDNRNNRWEGVLSVVVRASLVRRSSWTNQVTIGRYEQTTTVHEVNLQREFTGTGHILCTHSGSVGWCHPLRKLERRIVLMMRQSLLSLLRICFALIRHSLLNNS